MVEPDDCSLSSGFTTAIAPSYDVSVNPTPVFATAVNIKEKITPSLSHSKKTKRTMKEAAKTKEAKTKVARITKKQISKDTEGSRKNTIEAL